MKSICVNARFVIAFLRRWTLLAHIYQEFIIHLIKEYYDTFIKKPGEGICPICGKETIFLSLTKGYQKHCSSKCAGQDEFTLSIRRQTCLERYGKRYVKTFKL